MIDSDKVLVKKRRVDDDANPGHVVLPGGHVDAGESLKHAIMREMEEELEIRIGPYVPLSWLPHGLGWREIESTLLPYHQREAGSSRTRQNGSTGNRTRQT